MHAYTVGIKTCMHIYIRDFFAEGTQYMSTIMYMRPDFKTQTNRHTGTQTHRSTNRKTYRKTHGHTDKHIDRHN